MSCSSNPECGWCPSDGICYLRTLTSKCASNLKTQKCPGICPTLPDCQSCNLFSSSNNAGLKSQKPSVSQIIGKNHALKKYDQFSLNTSCFFGEVMDQILP